MFNKTLADIYWIRPHIQKIILKYIGWCGFNALPRAVYLPFLTDKLFRIPYVVHNQNDIQQLNFECEQNCYRITIERLVVIVVLVKQYVLDYTGLQPLSWHTAHLF